MKKILTILFISIGFTSYGQLVTNKGITIDSVSGTANNWVTQYQRKKTSDSLQTNINTNTTALGAKLDTASATKTFFTTLRQGQLMRYDSINARWYNFTALIDSPEHTFSAGTVTFTAGTAPSGASNLSYQWTQMGKCVTVRLNMLYAVAGATVTQVVVTWPADLPIPSAPMGFTGSGAGQYTGTGGAATLATSTPAAATKACIRLLSGVPQLFATFTSASTMAFFLTVTYFTP